MTHIYLIGNVEHNVFKIGITDNVGKRLKQLDGSGAPFTLTVLWKEQIGDWHRASELEKKLHSFFAKRRTRDNREWFAGISVDEFRCTLGALAPEHYYCTCHGATLEALVKHLVATPDV